MSNQGDWVAQSFTFHTEKRSSISMHYVTVGDPKNAAVLYLHATELPMDCPPADKPWRRCPESKHQLSQQAVITRAGAREPRRIRRSDRQRRSMPS